MLPTILQIHNIHVFIVHTHAAQNSKCSLEHHLEILYNIIISS